MLVLAAAAVLAAGIPAADLLSPPPPPVTNNTMLLDGRFVTGADTSYVDIELVGLDLVSVGYNPQSGQAIVSQDQFMEPGTLTRIGQYEKNDPMIGSSGFRRVDSGVMDFSSGQVVVVAGGQFNFTPPAHLQGVVCFLDPSPALMHVTDWPTPMPFDAFFLDVAVGKVLPGPAYNYWVAVGHVPPRPPAMYADRGIVVVGQYSDGFIPPPVIQEFTGSWLYFTAVEVAEIGGPPGPEIILAGVRENKSFLQVAKFDQPTQKVINLANTSFPSSGASKPWSVNVTDLDGDFQQEIIVGGQESNAVQNPTANLSRVSVWNWDGATQLTMKRDRVWTGVNSDSAVYDVEVRDFAPSTPGIEIASVGYNRNSSQNLSMAGELNLMDKDLKELEKMIWFGSDTDHWGMSSGDPDSDGIVEIVSAGMKIVGATEYGEIQVVEVPELYLASAAAPMLPAGLLLSRRLLARLCRHRA
jgi:hypothetical protein